MLSDKIIKHVGIRVRSIVYTGLAAYGWDNKKSELILPQYKWLRWNWNMANVLGYSICLLFCIFIHEQIVNMEKKPKDDLKSFALLVPTWGELITVELTTTIGTRIRRKHAEIQFAMNQIFRFHKQVSKWLEENNIALDEKHQKRIQVGEYLIFATCYISNIFPCILFVVLFNPLEPVHNMVLEWLKFEIALENMRLSLLALIPPLFLSLLGAANVIVIMMILGISYYLVAVSSIEDMTPVSVTNRQGRSRCWIQIQFYGEMEDKEIIQKYRAQQLLNGLVNDILASLAISSHHVGCLVIISICAFAFVRSADLLQESWLVTYLIFSTTILLIIFLEYVESSMLGTIALKFLEFKKEGNESHGKRSTYESFSRSCKTFYIESGYPYFKVDKATFLEFVNETLDKTVTLLL